MSDKLPLFLSIVIPAFNEEHRLTPALDSIFVYMQNAGYSYEVIVVDDGSKDKTSELVKSRSEYPEKLLLIRQNRNHGKGYAVKLGIERAGGEFVIFVDADGATPIEELEKLQKAIQEGADIAIASRALKESDVVDHFYRRLLGIAFNTIIRILVINGIKDTQCGFKLFKTDIAKRIFSKLKLIGFSFDVEVLFLAKKLGYKITEVPVSWRAIPGTKINPFTDSFIMFMGVVKIRFMDILGQYKDK